MRRVAIFGASGFGREVMPHAREQWAKSGLDHEIVFVDDNPPLETMNGHKVLTYADWLKEPADSRHINVAIANSKIRQQLVERCMVDGVQFFEVRAANVVQLDDITLGEGAILCPFSMLTSNIRIGRHFHANIYSYVAHDCRIGDFVTFAPGVMCNGNVYVEDHAYIGTGAVIKQGTPQKPLVIGRGAVIGMGAVVTKSVAPGTVVIGNPARLMSKT
jgi:sugar O-acyltransferase (sialic acid O-acetyltransferase NeuD family)